MNLSLMIRGLAIIAGIGFFVFIHELGHLVAAKISKIKVTDFFLGFGPKIFSFKIGETNYGIAAVPLGGYVKMEGSNIFDLEEDDEKEIKPENEDAAIQLNDADEINSDDDPRSFKNATFTKKLLIVLAGPFFNIVTAFMILTLVFIFTGEPTNVIDKTIEGKPAYRTLKAGDKIIEINDKEMKNWLDVTEEIRDNPDKNITIEVQRDNKNKTVSLKTESIKDKESKKKVGIIGIYPRSKRLGIIKSARITSVFFYEIVKTSNNLFISAFKGRPQKLLKNVSSPVGIVAVGAKLSTTILDYMFIIGSISFALGYFNLLPLPPLDGGHALVYLIEKIKGKPIKKKTLVTLFAIGAAILLTFLVAVVIKDILSFL